MSSNEKISGFVKMYKENKGWGFLTSDGYYPNDYFVHISNVSNADALIEGQKVEFRGVDDSKGKSAKDVMVIENVNSSSENSK